MLSKSMNYKHFLITFLTIMQYIIVTYSTNKLLFIKNMMEILFIIPYFFVQSITCKKNLIKIKKIKCFNFNTFILSISILYLFPHLPSCFQD